jgi:hypothetical protein
MMKLTLACVVACAALLQGCSHQPWPSSGYARPDADAELLYAIQQPRLPEWTEPRQQGSSLTTLIQGFNLYRNASALTGTGIRQELRARLQAETANPSELFNQLY